MKLNLSNITGGYGATSTLNANFDAIEQAIENTLSRDGTSPNEMNANLDMNGKDILNVDALDVESLTINGIPVQPSTGVAVGSAFQTYTFTATGGQTTFSVAPYTPYVASVLVEVNGLALPPTDISVSGTNVVIPACSAGDEVVIRRFISAPTPFPTSSDINFTQNGAGAVTRTIDSKLKEWISVTDFLSSGTDITIALQSALNTAAGKTCYIPAGNWTTTAMVVMSTPNSTLVIDDNATITYTQNTFIQITANSCSIIGGANGGLVGPATWDGVNAAPTYGVIWVAGRNCTVRGVRITNVKKVGIWVKDVEDCNIESCHIEGNYPSASWTGVETGHWGVVLDQGAGASGGNFKLSNCTIKTCVQGCQPGNYGIYNSSLPVPGPFISAVRGLVVTGNIFESCWNHGVYSNATFGAMITGNNFNRCQIPIVLTGDKNTVSGNTMVTPVDVVGDERDILGISIRDGSFNTVTGNTFKGVLVPPGNVAAINVQDVSGVGDLIGNIIADNTIDITTGLGCAIRISANTKQASGNIIQGNVVKASGNTTNDGIIGVYGASGRVAFVSGITQANPGVVTTSVAHGLAVNDPVTLLDVSGMTQINGSYLVNSVPTSTTLTLKSLAGTPLNTSGFSAYTANGEVRRTNYKHVGNKVSNNTIIATAQTFGIYCISQQGATVTNNTIEYAYNAGSAQTVPAISTFDSYRTNVANNSFVIRPTFGANISVQGFREYQATVNVQAYNNTCFNNIDQIDTTNGAFFQSIESVSGSGLLLDVYGPYTPTIPCAVGSTFRNTSGTSNATLYFKQRGTDGNGWDAVPAAPESASAVSIAAKSNAINTSGKYAGKLVWDTTNNRLMRSDGSTDVSPWRLVDGSVTVTPV